MKALNYLSDAAIICVVRKFVRFLSTAALFTVVVAVSPLWEAQADAMGDAMPAGPRVSDAMAGSIEAGPASCHDPNALCVSLQIPVSLSERPEALMLSLEENLGVPMCLPQRLSPFRLTQPALVPGRPLSVVFDAPVTGAYRLRAVIYMPGGGLASEVPVSGIDHVAGSALLELTGEPTSVSTPVGFVLSH